MANGFSANVYLVDTDGSTLPPGKLTGIKYIAGSGSSATIKSNGVTGGQIIWQDNGATGYDHVSIRDGKGYYVNLGGTGAKLYLYYE